MGPILAQFDPCDKKIVVTGRDSYHSEMQPDIGVILKTVAFKHKPN